MSAPATTTTPSRRLPVPRPLQKLFDCVPLLTYEANGLPARSQSATSGDLPTLYVFTSDEDARLGAPSFNPGCLKWQTFLRLAGVEFRILPSTNHASPTGSLPFLLPARTTDTKTAPEPETLRLDAYQALLDLPIRNAWLQALYLDSDQSALLDRLYIEPASSSRWIRTTLRHQLRRAAEQEILKTTSTPSSTTVDDKALYAAAWDAFNALAVLLAESETGWFFSSPAPTLFDASVFAYTHLMLQLLDAPDDDDEVHGGLMPPRSNLRRLGAMVRNAGSGELALHQRRVRELAWLEPAAVAVEGIL
ncbi:hypothetical protein B0T17DRAFT_624314 [Bombardia bombarda]|uniref:Uncharacterized protein n=1 Tax=Bombardia bombarda TaxID=252184 RepID=A0AA40CFJ2_9PEZI|nr:hypothetical protein B0T17DRAFT_624314 [Bombardia bombarda]